MQRVSLRFSWPEAAEAPFREEFYFGAWHGDAELHVAVEQPPAAVSPLIYSGPGYFLLGNTASLQPDAGLVHQRPAGRLTGPQALAFRGYVLDPPLHGWSGSGPVFNYWRENIFREHNGIFSVSRIFPDRLELITDAFGISPLYYRRLTDGTVLFATAARYLRLDGDHDVDPVAARMLLHRGSLCADASLVPGAVRCKPGHVITCSRSGAAEQEWFRFGSLPVGRNRITPETLASAEEAFQQAMDRCLRLMPGVENHLPLSSGDDSRRILAALLKRQAPFQALTVRFRQKQNRDLDGRFAAEMARALGFKHEVIEVAEPDQVARDHHVLRNLFSGELGEHSWMPQMVRRLRPHASLVFDGVGGDIFGNTGFAVPEWHTMPETGKLEQLAREFLPSLEPNSPYRDNVFVPIEQAWEEVVRYLAILPQGANRSDYAFALIRGRRGTGAAMQHLIPAGYVTVCPYFDLDHIRVTMELDSLDKIEEKLQARCLRVFWPDIYKFPGSRRIPPGIPEGPASFNAVRAFACSSQMRAECPSPMLLTDAFAILRPARYMQAVLSARSDVIYRRIFWWLERLLLLLSYRHSLRGGWSLVTTPSAISERFVEARTR